jgi:hypothetical protein
MGKTKQKVVIDEKKSKQKKALRIPMPKRGFDFEDKKKYNRKKEKAIPDET